VAPAEVESAMAVYLALKITIINEKRWSKHRDAVVPLFTAFGGTHVTKRGGVPGPA
jgi:hypothetical protein